MLPERGLESFAIAGHTPVESYLKDITTECAIFHGLVNAVILVTRCNTVPQEPGLP